MSWGEDLTEETVTSFSPEGPELLGSEGSLPIAAEDGPELLGSDGGSLPIPMEDLARSLSDACERP